MPDFIQIMRSMINTLLCAALLCGFHYLGTFIADILPLPITGPLYGLGLLLGCLFINAGFAKWITEAVKPLMQHMLFFFIPAVMGVTFYSDIIVEYAWAFFIAVVITTALSLGITGWFAQKWLATESADQ